MLQGAVWSAVLTPQPKRLLKNPGKEKIGKMGRVERKAASSLVGAVLVSAGPVVLTGS
jgi:hypothetical protein